VARVERLVLRCAAAFAFRIAFYLVGASFVAFEVVFVAFVITFTIIVHFEFIVANFLNDSNNSAVTDAAHSHSFLNAAVNDIEVEVIS